MAPPPPPPFDFAVDDSLAEWNLSAKQWLANNAGELRRRRVRLDGLAVGSLVFNREGKVLVVQRASHDSMPNRWEVPGGALDADDATILHGAARELWEEAGLVARRFGHLVTKGPGRGRLHVFPNRKKTRWFCRFSFDVDVDACESVRLDPAEHQAFAWASEDDVRRQKMGGRDMPITNKAMMSLILEAFRLRRETDGPSRSS